MRLATASLYPETLDDSFLLDLDIFDMAADQNISSLQKRIESMLSKCELSVLSSIHHFFGSVHGLLDAGQGGLFTNR